jgi:type IV pilus assembly protein PilA
MCRRYSLTLLMVLSIPRIVSAQTPACIHNDSPPQSARQALLEMAFARNPAQFFRHLPKHAQKLVRANSNILPLQAFSQALTPLQLQEGKLETFDNGPVLLRSENTYSHRTIEVSVESETNGLDEDQLQLSLHLNGSGKPEPLPFIPTAAFTMKSEGGTWRLDDIAIEFRVPLGNDEFLDSLTRDRRPPQVEEFEATAVGHVRTLNTAQVSYAATYPDLGFACSIAYLGGTGVEEPTSGSAGLIDSGLSSGSLDGYTFSIESCSGSPVDHFSVTAVPDNPQSGLRTFCSDESAVIRFSEDGDADNCLSAGEPLP